MKSSIAAMYLAALFGPFGLFCVIWTFLFLGRAELLSAVVALGFAVFALGMVAMLAIVASHKVVPRAVCGTGGTTFRPDSGVDRCLMTSTIAVFVAMAIYAVFAPLGMMNIPTPRGDEGYFTFMCAAGTLVGAFSVRQILRQRGMSSLRMSFEGIEMGSTMSTARHSWNELSEITDRPRKGRKPTGTTYITTTDGTVRTLPSDWYTPGGGELRKLVRFYWEHPDHRDELTDGRAVERLKAAA